MAPFTHRHAAPISFGLTLLSFIINQIYAQNHAFKTFQKNQQSVAGNIRVTFTLSSYPNSIELSNSIIVMLLFRLSGMV